MYLLTINDSCSEKYMHVFLIPSETKKLSLVQSTHSMIARHSRPRNYFLQFLSCVLNI